MKIIKVHVNPLIDAELTVDSISSIMCLAGDVKIWQMAPPSRIDITTLSYQYNIVLGPLNRCIEHRVN